MSTGRIVAVDSQALVWGIRRVGDPQQIKRATWLFESLDTEKAQIIVPSVVVAEYLTPIDKTRHGPVIASISKRFLVMPFDVGCVSLAAELFHPGKDQRDMTQPDCRKCLRSDTLIIATAKERGASILYAGDARCRNLASRVMKAEDLPENPPNLFRY